MDSNHMLAKKTILISGANRGLGWETSRVLAERGWNVLLGTREAQLHGQSVKEFEVNGNATWIHLDVSASESIQSAAQWLDQQVGKLDCLINNAGIYPDAGRTITTIPRQQMAQTFNTNTFGALELTQACLNLLKRSKAPKVINVSSAMGQLEGMSPAFPSYSLSKLAMNGLTLMLSSELASAGIAVNSVSPGWVRTDMGGPNADRSIEDGAKGIIWLADEASHDLTGKFFRDGKELCW